MGKLLTGVILFIIIITVFSAFPYALPSFSQGLYMPYELWFIILLMFYMILPKDVGTYVYNLQLEKK